MTTAVAFFLTFFGGIVLMFAGMASQDPEVSVVAFRDLNMAGWLCLWFGTMIKC